MEMGSVLIAVGFRIAAKRLCVVPVVLFSLVVVAIVPNSRNGHPAIQANPEDAPPTSNPAATPTRPPVAPIRTTAGPNSLALPQYLTVKLGGLPTHARRQDWPQRDPYTSSQVKALAVMGLIRLPQTCRPQL